MPARAYVLIETTVRESRQIANTLRSLPEVEAVDAVTGPYDIIAIVEAPDLRAVGDLVTGHIHAIDRIVRTITCLSVGSS